MALQSGQKLKSYSCNLTRSFAPSKVRKPETRFVPSGCIFSLLCVDTLPWARAGEREPVELHL